jgi:hypothetical protein
MANFEECTDDLGRFRYHLYTRREMCTSAERFTQIMSEQKQIPSGGYFIAGCRVTFEHVNDCTLSFEILNLCERGEGRGSRALRVICEIADRTGVTLIGVIRPFDDSPMDAEALRAFYFRHGFTTIKDDQIERLPFGWLRIPLKDFNERISTRNTSVRVQRSKVKGRIRLGGHDLFNNGREIFTTEEAAPAGEDSRMYKNEVTQ